MAVQTLPQIRQTLRLTAPLSGYLLSIELVPDPVFAQKMVGDGISIDPTSTVLLAPYDGEVVQIHPSHHAVTLKTAEGIEILMHIGLDTVELRGEGFTPKVNLGDQVTMGTPLIEFDMDYVALNARSLLTQVVVTNSERVGEFVYQTGLVEAGKDIFLELVLAAEDETAKATAGESVLSEPIVIPNPLGLHARPADPAKAAIFAAHQELLEDPDLMEIAESAIAKGKSAAFAWQRAYSTHADRLAQAQERDHGRARADLRDVGRRVLGILTNHPTEEPEIPADSILIAEEMSPSDTAKLDPARVLGFATVGGGATSHVAILARSLDIPAVAGIEPRALDLANGTQVILDGGKGQLRIDPDPAEVDRILTLKHKLAEKKQADLAAAHEPATTTDGHRVEVVANIGGLDDAKQSVTLGGEGVGLLRSEFLYLERQSAPTEDEQTQIYADIATALDGRPMIIRTLDVGGDKPLPYLPMPREENPFLGIRGVRIGLEKPELLRTQVRAILRAAKGHKLRMMFPMIATIDEIRSVKGLVMEERAKVADADQASRRRRARHHGGGAVGRGDGPAVRQGGRLLLHRHQRPDPVHPGHGPRPPEARRQGRRDEPGRAAADQADRRRRPCRGQMGRRLRRHRQRSAGHPHSDWPGGEGTQR
jgi:glucose-specific phosphotransferase system IIA component